MTETRKATEADVLDRVKFQLDYWNGASEKARAAVMENRNSDWALMEDLTKAYGRQHAIFELENLLDRMQEDSPRFTLLQLLEKMVQRTQEDLNRTRLFNSTSVAANAIGVEKMYAQQSLLELASGWLLVTKALQPAAE